MSLKASEGRETGVSMGMPIYLFQPVLIYVQLIFQLVLLCLVIHQVHFDPVQVYFF